MYVNKFSSIDFKIFESKNFRVSMARGEKKSIICLKIFSNHGSYGKTSVILE